jgi:hypothetical protein
MAAGDRRCKRVGSSVGIPNAGPGGKKMPSFGSFFRNHVTVVLLRAFLIVQSTLDAAIPKKGQA